VDVVIDPPVNQAIFDALKNRTTYLWVYLEVSYTDVFRIIDSQPLLVIDSVQQPTPD
jgi:hypothetical protein